MKRCDLARPTLEACSSTLSASSSASGELDALAVYFASTARGPRSWVKNIGGAQLQDHFASVTCSNPEWLIL